MVTSSWKQCAESSFGVLESRVILRSLWWCGITYGGRRLTQGWILQISTMCRISTKRKYKSILKLLMDFDTKWVCPGCELISKGISKGRWAKEMMGWTTQDFLLLALEAHIPSRTLRGILPGWTVPTLVLTIQQGTLPKNLTLIQLYYLRNRGQFIDVGDLCDLSIWTGSRGIQCIKDLRIDDGWGTIDLLKGQRCGYHFVG